MLVTAPERAVQCGELSFDQRSASQCALWLYSSCSIFLQIHIRCSYTRHFRRSITGVICGSPNLFRLQIIISSAISSDVSQSDQGFIRGSEQQLFHIILQSFIYGTATSILSSTSSGLLRHASPCLLTSSSVIISIVFYSPSIRNRHFYAYQKIW